MSELDALLAEATLVDLTQPLGPETVPWPGQAPLRATAELTHERDGAYTRRLELAEHTGTHLDAPAHFVASGARVDGIALETLVRPVAVLDVTAVVGDDPEAAVDRAALSASEAADGPIPAGSVALVRTGWDRFVGDPRRYAGDPTAIAFPGLTDDAAALLLERGVVGIGIDT
ncbi:MAG: cyclase family protein, partial [Gaiella sp.]